LEQTASERLAKVSKTAQEQAISLTQLSQMNKTLENERNDTARRLQDIAAELSQAQVAKEELQVMNKRNEDNLRKKEKEINDLKNALQDLGRAANGEQEGLENRINNVIGEATALRQQLRNTEAQLDEAKESLRSVQAEYETVRGDAEGMLKVMNTMETQLNEYATRKRRSPPWRRRARSGWRRHCWSETKRSPGKSSPARKSHGCSRSGASTRTK
jgi:chromosome segregation ATPase